MSSDLTDVFHEQGGNGATTCFMKTVVLSLVSVVSPFAGMFITTPAASAPTGAVQAPDVVYADGTYTGAPGNAYYGNVQMQLTIKGHQIAGFKLLDYPQHTGTSVEINRQALPILVNEMIAAQSASVDIVTGVSTPVGFQARWAE